MALEKVPKRATRSKTGCESCKIRRKKCDETKPVCLRCKKDRFECQYAVPKTWLFNGTTDALSPSTPSATSASTPNTNQLVVYNDTNSALTRLLSPKLKVILDAPALLPTPSSPWSFRDDQNYIQYYLHFLAPIFATTSRWHQFYYSFVPQIAWQHPSVHHAIVALAATYEACSTGSEKSKLVLFRTNQAIRAFAEGTASSDVALTVSRLLASADQCTGNFDGSIVHIGAAKKIILNTMRCGEVQSDIASLMVRSIMGLTSDEHGDDELFREYSPEARHTIANLKIIRFSFATLLQELRQKWWLQLAHRTRELVLTAWSTICQTMSAMFSPTVDTFNADEPITPVDDVRRELGATGNLQDSDELKITALQAMGNCVQRMSDPTVDALPISDPNIQQLKTCIDNFVVLAANVEPRMNAGTYWHDESHVTCAHHRRILYPQLTKNRGCGEGLLSVPQGQTGLTIEYVCPFRSGFGPAFLR